MCSLVYSDRMGGGRVGALVGEEEELCHSRGVARLSPERQCIVEYMWVGGRGKDSNL